MRVRARAPYTSEKVDETGLQPGPVVCRPQDAIDAHFAPGLLAWKGVGGGECQQERLGRGSKAATQLQRANRFHSPKQFTKHRHKWYKCFARCRHRSHADVAGAFDCALPTLATHLTVEGQMAPFAAHHFQLSLHLGGTDARPGSGGHRGAAGDEPAMAMSYEEELRKQG